MSRPLNILILGGGIAGLALAAALRQRSEHRVVVLERGSLPGVPAALIASGLQRGHSDVPDAQDYGIAIAPNGTRMLHILGVANPVAALGGKPLQEISTRSAENEESENSSYPLDPSAPAFFCRRSAMVRTLAQAAASPMLPGAAVQIHINVPVAELDVQTARYGEHCGDLIVLADGLSKAGRAAVVDAHGLPAELRDANTAQLAYMGLVPARALAPFSHLHDDGVPRGCLANWTWDPPHAAEEEADEAAEMARRGRAQQRLILYPLGDDALQLFAYQPATAALLERFPRGGAHGSRAGFIRDVDAKEATEVFAAFAPEVQELLRSCPTLDLAQIRDAPCLDNWAAGRAVLVGDAAHATLPHTGQGSAQALEDAEALSYLLAPLRAEPSSASTEAAAVASLDEALAAFVAVRTPRAHMVQRTARMLNGCLAPGEAQYMRDWDEVSYMMSMLTYAGVEQQLAAQQ